METNLKNALDVTQDLQMGCNHLVQAIDGHALSGAAYRAGANLFSELILPTVDRCADAISEMQEDLRTYRNADFAIQEASQETLDEAKLAQKIRECEAHQNAMKATANTLNSQAFEMMGMANPVAGIVSIANQLFDLEGKLDSQVESLEQDIEKLKRDLSLLQDFSSQTQGLFNDSLTNFKIVMQGALVLNGTIVNQDGSYSLPKGVDKSWFTKIHPNSNKILEQSSTNAFLELYKQTETLLKPMKDGKTDNTKRLEMVLKAYPASVVKKLLANDEFWMLANKLPAGWQTKLINGLAKYESFGQAMMQGKWIPKVDTLGKAFENLNKFTSPIKTYVSESLKNSQFIQGAKQWGVAKGLGKVATIATYAQLGITFVSSGVDVYGKTGSIGKGLISGAIDTVKSVGPLEGMTIGAAVAGPPGAIVGGIAGIVNVGIQFVWPNLYDDIKDGAYKGNVFC